MKAIVNTAPGRVEWQDCPMPEPGPGQVRIRTAACGVCATDLAMIAGWQRTGFPAIPGHEWSGMVDAVGPGVDCALLGKPCVAENVLVGRRRGGLRASRRICGSISSPRRTTSTRCRPTSPWPPRH